MNGNSYLKLSSTITVSDKQDKTSQGQKPSRFGSVYKAAVIQVTPLSHFLSHLILITPAVTQGNSHWLWQLCSSLNIYPVKVL